MGYDIDVGWKRHRFDTFHFLDVSENVSNGYDKDVSESVVGNSVPVDFA